MVNTAANTTDNEAPASEKQRKLKTNFGPRKSTTRKASLVAARSSEEVAVELPKQKAEDGDDELDDEDEDGTEVPVIIGGRNRSKDVKEKSRGGALKEKNKDKGVKGKNKEKAKGKNKEEAGGKKKEPNWFAADTPELIEYVPSPSRYR